MKHYWNRTRIDYLKFVTDYAPDQAQVYYEHLIKQVLAHNVPREYAVKHIKFTVLPRAGGRTTELRIFEMSGPICEYFYSLPLHWAKYLVRMDTKSYTCTGKDNPEFSVFTRILEQGPRYQCNIKSGGRESNNRDSVPGYIGFRMGSMKADLYVVLYKKRGEPFAYEVRMSDMMLRRGVSQCLEVHRSKNYPSPSHFWELLRDAVHKKGLSRVREIYEGAGLNADAIFHDVVKNNKVVCSATGEVVGFIDGSANMCYTS